MPKDPLSQMLPNAGYPAEEEAVLDAPLEAEDDLQIAFEDFDNPELPLEVRAGALKLILELAE